MEKTNEEVGAEFLLELIDTVDADEQAAFDAIRRFVDAVDGALPGGGKEGAPRRRVEIVEAALTMIEQLLGVSNDVARRMTESVGRALPEIERNAKRTATKSPAKKAGAKKAPAKRTTKKAPAKRTAKKAPARKAPAKRTTKKVPAKRTTKKTRARKAPAKRS